ncbi:cobW-domain-containing protein [Phellopilus nigrolimitatus]|nr:cobW-domain-containing protein [Phellopilus nigrolimitatus]
MTIPITVFTGFLGAGKTTLILSLLPVLPKGYKACLLKNEFGDVQVDSQLAKQSSLTAVSEILNGCMCCVLVGQMKTALLEIKNKFRPDRVFIETSGSAFPATLAFQIRELERETDGEFKLDAIVTVVDAENFIGYEDTSPTARMQASYTDLILINKWEHISERQLDIVLDHLHTLNDLTPKIKCNGRGGVDPNLVFGLDSKLFNDPEQLVHIDCNHNDEVQTLTIWRGSSKSSQLQPCSCDHIHAPLHTHTLQEDRPVLTEALLTLLVSTLPKESVWRIKGFAQLTSPLSSFPDFSEPPCFSVIVNWAFGRLELTPHLFAENAAGESSEQKQRADVLLTVMGERGEIKRIASKFARELGAEIR